MLRNLLVIWLIAGAVAVTAGCDYLYLEVVEVTPLPGESAVSVDQNPTLVLTAELELDRSTWSLTREADGSAVPGRVVQDRAEGRQVAVRFVPDAPLEPATDYRLVVEGGLDGYFFLDPISNRTVGFDAVGAASRFEVPFTTRSAPAVRHTRRYAGHAHLYLSFSQDMNPRTFSPDSVRVQLDGVAAEPLTLDYEGGPAHLLKVTMRRVDFTDAAVSFVGVEAMDGAAMSPEIVEIAAPR